IRAYRCTQDIGEVALMLECSGQGNVVDRLGAIARALIVREEEEFIFLDWAANDSTKLVINQLRHSGSEVIARCTKALAAVKLEKIAMKFVRAGLESRSDDAAGETSVLRRNAIRNNCKFLDSIQIWRDHG